MIENRAIQTIRRLRDEGITISQFSNFSSRYKPNKTVYTKDPKTTIGVQIKKTDYVKLVLKAKQFTKGNISRYVRELIEQDLEMNVVALPTDK